MPGFLQVAAQANPLKHFLVIVQGSFLKDLSTSQVFAGIRPMLIIFTVTFTLAVVFVTKRLE